MFFSLTRNVCLCVIPMTTAAIPVDEFLSPLRTIVNYSAPYYVYLGWKCLLNNVQGNIPLPLIYTYIISHSAKDSINECKTYHEYGLPRESMHPLCISEIKQWEKCFVFSRLCLASWPRARYRQKRVGITSTIFAPWFTPYDGRKREQQNLIICIASFNVRGWEPIQLLHVQAARKTVWRIRCDCYTTSTLQITANHIINGYGRRKNSSKAASCYLSSILFVDAGF